MLALIAYVRTYLRQDLRMSDRGATAVEYGLMVALIAVVIIGAVAGIGGALDDMFTDVCTQLGGAAC